MSFWHEARKLSVGGGCISSQKNEGLFSCIRYPDFSQNETEFSIYAQAWIGKGEPESWFTQGWIELWPRTPIVASDF